MFFVPSPEVLVCLSSLIKPKAQQKTDLFYNKYMYKKQYKIGSYDKKKHAFKFTKFLHILQTFLLSKQKLLYIVLLLMRKPLALHGCIFRAHQPNSHSKYGWQSLTDAIIRLVSETQQGVVFILWGGFAHKKEKLIDQKKNAVIKTAHPSPLSFGKFINCRCFSNANGELKKFKKSPVDWTL